MRDIVVCSLELSYITITPRLLRETPTHAWSDFSIIYLDLSENSKLLYWSCSHSLTQSVGLSACIFYAANLSHYSKFLRWYEITVRPRCVRPRVTLCSYNHHSDRCNFNSLCHTHGAPYHSFSVAGNWSVIILLWLRLVVAPLRDQVAAIELF